jgi:caffeoyl-CoA O-methyltransferase
MFHDIPRAIADRMGQLETLDAEDRTDGTPYLERLRQIPPETGRFIALLAAASPAGRYIEIGTSAGYSTLWLALACRAAGRKITTFEILDHKADLARETIRLAGVEDTVELVHGDALAFLPDYDDIAFCFLDAEKDLYLRFYELVVPKMVSGALLVADNAINMADVLQPMIDRSLADDRVDAMVVPVGKGELVCRRV